MRRSLYANEATLIMYEDETQLLWWDGVPIGRLIDSLVGPGNVETHVASLHLHDREMRRRQMERMGREARS